MTMGEEFIDQTLDGFPFGNPPRHDKPNWPESCEDRSLDRVTSDFPMGRC